MSEEEAREPIPGIDLTRLEDAGDWLDESVRAMLGRPTAYGEITVTCVVIKGRLTRWIRNPQISHENQINRGDGPGLPIAVSYDGQ